MLGKFSSLSTEMRIFFFPLTIYHLTNFTMEFQLQTEKQERVF